MIGGFLLLCGVGLVLFGVYVNTSRMMLTHNCLSKGLLVKQGALICSGQHVAFSHTWYLVYDYGGHA